MKLKELAAKFVTDLNLLYEEDEAMAIFLIGLKHYLNFSRADYLLKKEQELSENEKTEFHHLLKELRTGKPIQYILGETAFYGLKFKVNSSVLIPRPETEELVAWILEKVQSYQLPVTGLEQVQSYRLPVMGLELTTHNPQPTTILDIGTGSGCIAISLKKNLPQTEVHAIDIDADALTTAHENALLNHVEVKFIQQDILHTPNSKPTTHNPQPTTYNIIVSNPPYIKEDEKEAMHHNVLANEPLQALFVSNENPLIFYNAIADFALKSLEKNGLLFFEINEYLGEQTVNLLKDKGFINIELRKDMQGKDRMIFATCYSEPNLSFRA